MTSMIKKTSLTIIVMMTLGIFIAQGYDLNSTNEYEYYNPMVIMTQSGHSPDSVKGGVKLITKNGTKTLINSKGKIIARYPSSKYVAIIDNFKDGWGRIRVGEKVGLHDGTKWIIKPKDCNICLCDGIASVTIIYKTGIITKEGNWLIEPMEKLYSWDNSDKVLVIKYDGKFGIINKNGWIFEPQFNEMERYSENMIEFRIGKNWGFIDNEGKIAIKPQYKYVRRYSQGLAAVNVDGKWGFIDKKGTMVIEPSFDNVGYFSENLCEVEINDKWGFIDQKGKIVIEPIYEAATRFSCGLACVKSDNYKWGFIDTSGKMVIEPQFDTFSFFDSETGKAWVRIGDEESGITGYIDKTGKFTPYK